MDKIKRFFECLIPVTACNLKCSYCYIIQRDKRQNKIPELKYSPELIGKALTKERLGGVCYFSICGAGETLIPEYTIEIVRKLLENGHYVNITTNGTLNKRFDQILEFPADYLKRLQIAFSFHYLELIRTYNIDNFFNNVKKMRNAGCSILVQLNLCDEYIPYLNEIKKICMEHLGAYPQIAATRKENELTKDIELMTSYTKEEYIAFGQEFNSQLFNFTMKNFNVRRREFCYAGDWTFTLNLQTGIMKRCYSSYIFQNVFENIDKPIRTIAVGKGCRCLFCLNSSHFMSLGVIPSIDTPTYVELRDRENANWYNSNMKEFLSQKLVDNNSEYSNDKKIFSQMVNILDGVLNFVWRTYGKLRNR